MLLGDVIARFEDEAFVNETLVALDDLALTARIATLAAKNNVSAGELARHLLGRFVNGASDEEWLTLIGQMSRAENPGQVFLRRALKVELDLNKTGLECCDTSTPSCRASKELVRCHPNSSCGGFSISKHRFAWVVDFRR